MKLAMTKSIQLLVILAGVLWLTGCGGGGSDAGSSGGGTTNPPSTSTDATFTVTLTDIAATRVSNGDAVAIDTSAITTASATLSDD